jgi:galactokinase
VSTLTRDLEGVCGVLAELERSDAPALAGLFDPAEPLLLARAPGRLDVMGGFADYSGSLTLELPIREAAYVAAQPRRERWIDVVSAGFGPGAGPRRHVRIELDELERHSTSYQDARAYFARDAGQGWVAYVAGALVALRIELDRWPVSGLSLLVASSVPEGKGVSSSAAVEVASLSALAGLFDVSLDPVRSAFICQRIENLVVGAPCGLMDQMTSSCGSEGQLLPLLCQPAELLPGLPLPPSLGLWGIDSGLRHEVSGADYGQVRVAAFMGYRWLADARGLRARATQRAGLVEIEDPEWGGYLARVPLGEFEQRYRALLPERCGGAEFLQRFGGITDPITRVRDDVTYRVRAASEHPVREHQRASEFRQLLASPELDAGASERQRESVLERLGALMYQAHLSYSACGLGSTGTDRIVELVRELGPEHGLYGAKITGGGSGGTVAVLGRADAAPAVRAVVERYAGETGLVPHLFAGSSPGAAAFGLRRLAHTAKGWRLTPKSVDTGQEAEP